MNFLLNILGLGWLVGFVINVGMVNGASVDQEKLDIPQIKTLEKDVETHKLLTHDLLKCLQNGGFHNTTDAVKTFFSHHYVYSHHFIDYLNKVLDKISLESIREPIEENIEEENGNYEEKDLKIMEDNKVKREWFQNIPHKELSARFLESAGVDRKHLIDMENNPNSKEAKKHAGLLFTQYMLDMYDKSNACEAVAVIGFAIEETVSKLYSFIYDSLQDHTKLSPSDYVFFPLHILIDDGHADLLKLAYKHYIENKPSLCKNAPNIVHEVLDRRSKMFDMVKQEIEQKQGHTCKLDQTNNNENNKEKWFETSDNAVNMAQVESNAQVEMIENEYKFSLFEKMSYSAKILSTLQGHGDTLSGQISCINQKNPSTIWVTPYGKPLNIINKNDFLLIDEDLNVLKTSGDDDKENEEFLKVNKATRFHFHVYKKRPDMKCIIHTHPPYTSALGMTGYPLKPLNMDTMAFYNDVQYLNKWPGIPFGSEEGDIISKVLGDKSHAALLANHGLIVGADSIEKTTYYAYFFERGAQMQLNALAAVGGDINKLPNVDPKRAIRAREWRIKNGPVKSHFYAWVNLVNQLKQ